MTLSGPRHIAFLVVPGFTLLDLAGPYEVFTQAIHALESRSRGIHPSAYILQSLSAGKSRKITSDSGLSIHCDFLMESFEQEIDTLFVCGIPNSLDAMPGKNVYQWIKKTMPAVKRLCSVCTGTFFLAEAGILEKRKATTHWELCGRLARDYPGIQVENDPIFIKDGNIYTSAGISAGMDLALALVEEDYGRKLALQVARQMVLYLKRPGTQSQYSTALTLQNTDYRPIQDLEIWIHKHLDTSLSVALLAEKAGMSPRNFARVFSRETGTTPAKYIEKLRLESARQLLTETQLELKEISEKCGFSSPDNMRKVFLKFFKTTPSLYRQNFRSAFPDHFY